MSSFLGNLFASRAVLMNEATMTKTAIALPLALGVTVFFLACRPQEAPPLSSGIEGQAVLGPMCPVVREDTPCPDQPFQATIVVWSSERTQRVRTFTTDEQGGFRVALLPGRYYIDPQPSSGQPPSPIPQTVAVLPGQFVQITVEYDSGIR